MLSIFFLVIIGISIAVIVFILVRKFPRVANLDLTSLPEEAILQKKNEIIYRRVQEQSKKVKNKVTKYLSPFKRFWGKAQLKFRIYVGKIEKLVRHERSINNNKKKQTIDKEVVNKQVAQIIVDGEEFLRVKNYTKAEESFISAIKIDNKCAVAYRGLGEVYFARQGFQEARQTYKFLLQLDGEDDSVMVRLAEIAISQGDLEEAIEYYQSAVLINDSFSTRFFCLAELLLRIGQPTTAREAIIQAVELEPKNPKYLDLLVEVAIICNDKKLAWKGFTELRLVNAENAKLDTFKEKIEKMR